MVGLEREYFAKQEAGARTFSLVTLGSALITGLSFDLFDPGSRDSAARIIANVVVGIGFLGGGAIVKEAERVQGLTTAAGIWAMAAVGIAVGSERYLLGILAIVVSSWRAEPMDLLSDGVPLAAAALAASLLIWAHPRRARLGRV